MKLLFMLFIAGVTLAAEQETRDHLTTLAKKMYEMEDKVDHLLFHFSHDVTKHKYQATPFGTFLAPDPKNPNSIHQKLKLVDYLNHQQGHPGAWQTAANNAYNMGMGVPGAPMIPGAPMPNMFGFGGAAGGMVGADNGMGMGMGAGMGQQGMRKRK